MATFSTLCLGNRNDADWWRRGMTEKLGFGESKWIKKVEPTTAEIGSYFGSTDNWIYIGGHFSAPPGWPSWPYPGEKRAYNDIDNNYMTPPTREILFRFDHALVRSGSGSTWSEKKLVKGTEFKQTGSGRVLLFGGCAIAERKADIIAFQTLFDKPLIIGWTKTTSRKMINLMLGGDGGSDAAGSPWSAVNFWSKLGGNFADPVKVRQAWLAAADALFTVGDPFRSHFAVIDATHVHTLDAAPFPIGSLP